MGGHSLLSKIMKRIRNLRPAKARSVPNWNLDVVLSALAKPPFEPLGLTFLKQLSMKVAFLLAIMST
jgi:hypothetical protein